MQETPMIPAAALFGVPSWLIALVGFVLIGIASSLLTIALRETFPPSDQPKSIKIHYLYPFAIGVGLAVSIPDALPELGVGLRALAGLISSALWAVIYTLLKSKSEAKFGIKLPESDTLLTPRGDKPT